MFVVLLGLFSSACAGKSKPTEVYNDKFTSVGNVLWRGKLCINSALPRQAWETAGCASRASLVG